MMFPVGAAHAAGLRAEGKARTETGSRRCPPVGAARTAYLCAKGEAGAEAGIR